MKSISTRCIGSMHTYIYTYIHTYIHPYIHTYIHTHTHTYTYIHIHANTHIHIRSLYLFDRHAVAAPICDPVNIVLKDRYIVHKYIKKTVFGTSAMDRPLQLPSAIQSYSTSPMHTTLTCVCVCVCVCVYICMYVCRTAPPRCTPR
jgi:hypothetical protein